MTLYDTNANISVLQPLHLRCNKLGQIRNHISCFFSDRSNPLGRKREAILKDDKKAGRKVIENSVLTVPVSRRCTAYVYLIPTLLYIQSMTFPGALETVVNKQIRNCLIDRAHLYNKSQSVPVCTKVSKELTGHKSESSIP